MKKELKLEVGKCYKTHDGTKIRIVSKAYNDNEEHIGFNCTRDDIGTPIFIRLNGKRYSVGASISDIISEWEE